MNKGDIVHIENLLFFFHYTERNTESVCVQKRMFFEDKQTKYLSLWLIIYFLY